MAEFTHLHVHSEYSLLDGLSKIKHLVKQAKANEMTSLAITDHGSMYGAIDFYSACKEAEINPIIGVEAYLTPNSIEDRSGKFDYFHLLLLAKNEVGYRNLLKLTTIAHTKGYHYKPRIDKQTLSQYADGLIATSTCLSGEIPTQLLKGDINGARQTVNWYREVFGDENFFLEVQDHQADESEQGKLNQLIYDLHKETGLPLVATNDLHYVHADDAVSQDTLLCIQTGKTIDDPKRMKFDSSQYYLKSAEEMALLFGDVPDALKNTMRIAEMCKLDLDFGQALLPNFPIPDGYKTQDEYLYKLCLEGLQERYGEVTDVHRQRLDYEFQIIATKGFVPYFLVVWDFVNYARREGIRCSARGSAAGSIVGYALGITNVDPLRHNLTFERFLNPERKSMPDIDMDFPDDRREEVIVYVANKYGWDKVAQIVTFGTMAAKASVRDVGRVLGWQNEADRVARLIPTAPKITLQSALDSTKELQQLYEQSETVHKLIDRAAALEGTVRNTGIHAAGVVISRDPLDQFVPLQLRDPKDPNSWLVSQYEQPVLEKLGLLKMDFLGLSNLTILQNSVDFIKQTRGIDLDLEHIPQDDKETFDLLASGETTGVFQLESGAMRQYIKELKPTVIDDLTAMVALYRPGPMDSIPTFIKAKHGEIQIKYLHPSLEQFLKDSYGVIVYQDQVLLIAVNLAGFTWGEVDAFRKAMGKKIPEVLQKYRSKFIEGCIKNGISEKIADEIFVLIEPFGGYGFNRAHAASYAWVAYQTAYLKAHYTPEFMAATLTTEMADAKKVVAAISECRRMGVEVMAPDVNYSRQGFTVEGNGVRFGLLAIKNVGTKPVDEIVAIREKDGKFKSLAGLCSRIDTKMVTKGALETLIKAGAMDSLGPRSSLLASLERAISIAQQQRKIRESGQQSLFGGGNETPDDILADFHLVNVPDLPRSQILAWEKELLNLYLSEHPLSRISTALKKKVTLYTSQVTAELAGQKVVLGGRVAEVRRITTKKGDTMAAVQFEDMHGTIEVIVFPKTYEATSHIWKEESILIINGKIDCSRDDEPKIICESVEVFEMSQEEMDRKQYLLRIQINKTGNEVKDIVLLQETQRVMHAYPGTDRYDLYIKDKAWQAMIKPEDNTARYCPEMQQQLESILGPGTVEIATLDSSTEEMEAEAVLVPAM